MTFAVERVTFSAAVYFTAEIAEFTELYGWDLSLDRIEKIYTIAFRLSAYPLVRACDRDRNSYLCVLSSVLSVSSAVNFLALAANPRPMRFRLFLG
jgi:hypothetical protein